MATRKQEKLGARARAQQMRAEQRARERRRRIAWYAGGAVVAVIVAGGIIVVSRQSPGTGSSSSSAAREVIPPGVGGGTPDVQPPALVVANTTGIPGVVAYDTTGWPATSHNGPAARALPHNHVNGSIRYSVTPPVGGDHNGVWMNCGVYNQPVPAERAVHDLEHGAIWMTYQPSLPHTEVQALRAFEARQSIVPNTGSRYIDLTPFPGLPAPIVVSSWGFQLRLTSPADPRLQKFVNMFRVSQPYTPEYGAPCTGGVGTPLHP